MKTIQLTQQLDAIVDEQDYEHLRTIRWCVSKNRKSGKTYAVGTINGKQVRMHRYLLQVTNPNVVIDHINGNGLDNRRANLRLATFAQNTTNSGPKKTNTSGYKGVSFAKGKKSKPWAAYLGGLKKSRFLGYFVTPIEAALAYDKAAAALYGEFAYLNFKQKINHDD